MLTSDVLPEPEGPNSAVSRAARSRSARRARKSPSRWLMSTASVIRCPIRRPTRRASSSEASSASIEMAIEISVSRSAPVIAARHLREGVDRRRQRLRLAGDVGDEGDGGAELAHRLGEAQDHAGDDAGQDQRQGDGRRTPSSGWRRACRPPPPASRSTASIDSRIARTISGKPMTPQASAAPVQRNEKTMPKCSAEEAARPARAGRRSSSSR